MKKDELEVLKSGNDLLINQISNQINNSNNLEDKERGRNMMAFVMNVGSKIDSLLNDEKEN